MWRILLGLWVLAGVLPHPAGAQQWTGTAALTLTGGHQTNVYLDPVLRSWDLTSDPTFAALTPQVGLVRNARRSRLDVMARMRLYPRRSNVPQFAQGYSRYQYRLSPSWTVGGLGGATRYRFVSSRDSWWVLPSVQWSPIPRSSLTLRGGVTRRTLSGSGFTNRQTSAVVSLTGDTWLTDRLYGKGRLYWSNGRASASDVQFGGTGASVRGTYWLTSRWAFEAEAAVERIRYGTGPAATAIDRLGRVGLKTEWHVQSSVTLFARARASAADLAGTETLNTDVHVSAGLRLHVQRVLGGTAAPPPRRRVCTTVEEGVRFQIPYDGPGTPHVTGDFNGWSLPGVPMTPSGDDTWTATLSLAPGEYTYRIRIVDGTESRWLDLPSYAQTADDAFGGTNGVCTVH
ncbi:MAG: glycogen-binding domain-containing protein [Salinibacter sp.]